MKLPKWNEWYPGMASAYVFIKSILISDVYTLGILKKIYLSLRLFLITSKMFEIQAIRKDFFHVVNLTRKVRSVIKKQFHKK